MKSELDVPAFFQSPLQKYLFSKISSPNPENHKHMTIKINMAARNLKSLGDFIVSCYGTNVIDDFEFILLYYYNQSR